MIPLFSEVNTPANLCMFLVSIGLLTTLGWLTGWTAFSKFRKTKQGIGSFLGAIAGVVLMWLMMGDQIEVIKSFMNWLITPLW